MNKTVHTLAGMVPFALASVVMPTGFDVLDVTVYPTVALFGAVIGSLLPDFDLKPMHYSQGKKGIQKAVAKGATKVVNKATGGHRGITHTLLFPVLIGCVLYYISSTLPVGNFFIRALFSFIFGIFSGWCLHLFADMFNGKGCPLLWPLIQSKIPGIDLPSEGIVPYMWLVCYSVAWVLLIC